jgi:hypothetical protein
MGKGVNLGQMFESTQQPRTLAAASAKIDAYYAKGFRSVRIPITWTEPVGGDRLVNDANVGDVNRGHPRLAVIEQVVDFALAKPDLYVVINAHHESTLKTQSRSWVLERLWQDIAEIFADRDHRLIFELLNEPHRSDGDNSPMPAADLREMSALAYAKIRAVDPHRIVAIGGNQWFGAGEMAQVWPSLEGVGDGQDAYLMATFHHSIPGRSAATTRGATTTPGRTTTSRPRWTRCSTGRAPSAAGCRCSSASGASAGEAATARCSATTSPVVPEARPRVRRARGIPPWSGTTGAGSRSSTTVRTASTTTSSIASAAIAPGTAPTASTTAAANALRDSGADRAMF